MERGQNPNIISGRMPVAVVHLLRFGNHKAGATKDNALLFGTTVGKVDDVKKNRNFAYVVAETKFTQAQIDEGVTWLKRHPKYDEAKVDQLVVELESYSQADETEAAAFEAKRTEARGQPVTTKDGVVADGGGGNRRKPRKSKKDEVAATVAGVVEGDQAATEGPATIDAEAASDNAVNAEALLA